MELGVLERTVVMQLLPTESDYITYKVVTDLRDDLGFSEEELKEFEIKSEGTQITWDSKKAKVKEVKIGVEGAKIIGEALKKLDEQGKINVQNASLYEKFVLDEVKI